MLRHVVLFKYKPEADEAARAAVAQAFVALKGEIAFLRALEWGRNESPEGLDKGYTHCFVLSFDSAADRDAYLPHPAHQRFVAFVQPWLAEVLVFDYATQA